MTNLCSPNTRVGEGSGGICGGGVTRISSRQYFLATLQPIISQLHPLISSRLTCNNKRKESKKTGSREKDGDLTPQWT
jgi:hypothetical protein